MGEQVTTPEIVSKDRLKLLYNDIIKGFSVSVFAGSSIYIKHLTATDSSDFDLQYNSYFEEARGKGAPMIEEQEVLLIEEGS